MNNKEIIERLEYLKSGARVVLSDREREAVEGAINRIRKFDKIESILKEDFINESN